MERAIDATIAAGSPPHDALSIEPDIVVVGAGIAGSALAAVLARDGHRVAVLERSARYVDQVRGEFLALWGVVEARRLGLLDTLLAAGAAAVPQAVAYDENAPLEQAEARARDLSTVFSGVPGPLCCGHPVLCEALAGRAQTAGAMLLRETTAVEVTAAPRPGERPMVSFEWHGLRVAWRPRLIVGADGRNSTVRRQLGIELGSDAPHHYIGGMLVEGVPQWPSDVFSIGTEGDLHYFVFPQGGGRLRLYACWSLDQARRFAGPERRQRLLDAFGGLACLRHAGAIARSTPAGPFNAFANEDRWTDRPLAPGVVLIGDAAGYNDPIAGQGLAIALRDVRLLRDAIDVEHAAPAALEHYAAERAERMRRLRVAARLLGTLRAEFGEAARARRERALRRTFVEGWPSPIPCTVVGPDLVPHAAFEPATIERLLAAG